MSFELPSDAFWAAGGEMEDDRVAPVDPADLRKVLTIHRDAVARLSHRNFGIGRDVFQSVCSAGADIRAVCYRASVLLLLPGRHGLLSRWSHSGEFDDAAVRVAARFPVKKLRPGVVHQGFPFDGDEFIKQIERDQDKEAAP